jgi:hypothetical protein
MFECCLLGIPGKEKGRCAEGNSYTCDDDQQQQLCPANCFGFAVNDVEAGGTAGR